VRRSLCILVVCGACNATWGIESTTLVNENPRTLVFDNSASRVDLVEFPVLVILDGQRIDYTEVRDPATDLRFHAPIEDIDLPFEIDQWNPAGESYVWVRVPRIAAGSKSDSILMYFGADAGGVEKRSEVWNDYDLVLHGKPQGTRDAFTSSAPPPMIGDVSAVTTIPGRVGSSFVFTGDGTDHSIEFGGSLLDGWPTYTLEMWIYLDYTSSAGFGNPGPEPQFFDKPGDALRLGRIFGVDGIDFLFQAQLDTDYVGTGAQYVSTFVRVQRWAHLLWTFDGSTQWLYRDGDFSDVIGLGGPTTLIAGNSPVVFGGHNGSINGMLDELRISRSYRGPDWVLAQYLAMSDRFVTFPRPGEVL